MMPDLTDEDRAVVNAVYRDNGWDPNDQLSEYRLCEAGFIAGLAAGRARAIEECLEAVDGTVKVRGELAHYSAVDAYEEGREDALDAIRAVKEKL